MNFEKDFLQIQSQVKTKWRHFNALHRSGQKYSFMFGPLSPAFSGTLGIRRMKGLQRDFIQPANFFLIRNYAGAFPEENKIYRGVKEKSPLLFTFEQKWT